MRRWMLGLLIFLFLALTVFSLILGRQLKKIAETHHSFLKTPTARAPQAQ